MVKKKPLQTVVFVSVLNHFRHPWNCEGDVSPNRSTEPPIFLPLSPENDTVYAEDTISLSSSLNAGTPNTLKVGNSVLEHDAYHLS